MKSKRLGRVLFFFLLVLTMTLITPETIKDSIVIVEKSSGEGSVQEPVGLRQVMTPVVPWAYPREGKYTPEDLNGNAVRLASQYPGIIVLQEIGRSVQGRPLWALKLGKGSKEIMINAAHHGREWMTAYLVMRQIETYALSYMTEEKVGNYPVRELLDEVSIWFVPLMNPDGMMLSQEGAERMGGISFAQAIIKMNEGDPDVSGWKANIRGVDLNRQYDVNWRRIPKIPGPSAQDYKGSRPLSEPETKAMVAFTLKHNFLATINYHSSGSVIYWYAGQGRTQFTRDSNMAEEIGRLTGYELVPPEPRRNIGGGYKDWFFRVYGRPSYTVEVGKRVDRKPLKWDEFSEIWRENREVPLYLADKVK